jgi:hypothetical protein
MAKAPMHGEYGWIISLVVGLAIWRLLSIRSNPNSHLSNDTDALSYGAGHYTRACDRSTDGEVISYTIKPARITLGCLFLATRNNKTSCTGHNFLAALGSQFMAI